MREVLYSKMEEAGRGIMMSACERWNIRQPFFRVHAGRKKKKKPRRLPVAGHFSRIDVKSRAASEQVLCFHFTFDFP